MTHAQHEMHDNSFRTYHQERGKLSTRKGEILKVFAESSRPLTDRNVMIQMGFYDMNTVRPRISELVRDGYLIEEGSAKCPITGKDVRTCGVRK